MSCFNRFNCFSKPNVQKPDLRIYSPLNLDELPNTILELQAFEAATIDILVSLHYQLEDVKSKLENLTTLTPEKNELLAKRFRIAEKKKVFDTRLQKIQAKMKEIKAT